MRNEALTRALLAYYKEHSDDFTKDIEKLDEYTGFLVVHYGEMDELEDLLEATVPTPMEAFKLGCCSVDETSTHFNFKRKYFYCDTDGHLVSSDSHGYEGFLNEKTVQDIIYYENHAGISAGAQKVIDSFHDAADAHSVPVVSRTLATLADKYERCLSEGDTDEASKTKNAIEDFLEFAHQTVDVPEETDAWIRNGINKIDKKYGGAFCHWTVDGIIKPKEKAYDKVEKVLRGYNITYVRGIEEDTLEISFDSGERQAFNYMLMDALKPLLIEADIEMRRHGDDERLIYRVFNGKVKVISKDVARKIVWWCHR